MKVQLIVVQGKPEGKAIPLTTPRFLIGRGEECHLRPSSDQISRKHSEITIAGDKVSIRDLGSRNGTLVNGKALTAPYELKNGDLIQVGNLTFATAIEGAASPSQAGSKAARGRSDAKAPSLDDVSHDQIDAWLVADENREEPESPSGVYGGDTMTFAAYQGGSGAGGPAEDAKPAAAKAAPKPAAEPPKPAASKPAPAKPAPAPAPAPTVSAEPAPSPAPRPAAEPPKPAAPQPVAVSSAPPKPPVPKPAAAQAKLAPRPVEPEPEPEAEAEAEAEPPLLGLAGFDLSMDFERLPEGEGDPEPEALQQDEGDESEPSGGQAEELMDESNPFFIKPSKPEPAAPAKPSSRDSSDAAKAILNKMMDRKRSK